MNLNKLEGFLSVNTKTLLAITCCILFAYIICRKPRTIYENSGDPVKLSALQEYKDANGQLYYKLQQKIVELEQVKTRNDSLAKALGIKPKYIKGEDKIVILSDTEFIKLPSKEIITVKDTMYRVEKHDSWLDVVALAGKTGGSISLKIRDSLTRIETLKRSLFKADERTVYILSNNPYMKPLQGSSFVIREKKPWLTIGPYAGYDPFGKRFSAGISAQLPIIKFNR